jgi:hypothetical protein
MIKNREEAWKHLDEHNIDKIWIMFSAKYKKKSQKTEFNIESVMCKTKCGKNEVDWDNEIYSEVSYFSKPIYEKYEFLKHKIDGLLVWDNEKKKVIINGKIIKKIKENFREEV